MSDNKADATLANILKSLEGMNEGLGATMKAVAALDRRLARLEMIFDAAKRRNEAAARRRPAILMPQ